MTLVIDLFLFVDHLILSYFIIFINYYSIYSIDLFNAYSHLYSYSRYLMLILYFDYITMDCCYCLCLY